MMGDDLEEMNCDFEEGNSGAPVSEAMDFQRTSQVKSNNFQGGSFHKNSMIGSKKKLTV
jgi:hypothetical protein